ncbi:MAG: signal recognition particle protein [Nitrospirae bacterium]|nr:signal recognition particle protein [Nitrospirota bacterium]
MFEALTDRFDRLFRKFADRKTLSEKEVRQFLDELRGVLLAGDVHLDVVKKVVEDLGKSALDQAKIAGVTATEQLLSLVGRHLVDLLGGQARKISFLPEEPKVVMLVGLQGTGKTTTAAKLARLSQRQGCKPILVALDWKRPAAIEQLEVLGRRLGVPVFRPAEKHRHLEDAVRDALALAREQALTPVILDTAGRLHVDQELMDELKRIREIAQPAEILFVADGAVGQDAAVQARTFHESIGITGVILTKLDGDARAGAALSISSVTGKPIVWTGVGEELDALEEFHPERMASRILGYGDLQTLFEKVQERVSAEKEARFKDMMASGRFTLDDFREQIQQVTSFGPLESVLKLIPGVGKMLRGGADMSKAEKDLKRTLAVIDSMTRKERAQPVLLDGRRRRRIAKGSGTKVEDVNRVLNQYGMFKKMFLDMSKRGPAAFEQDDMMKALGSRMGMRM